MEITYKKMSNITVYFFKYMEFIFLKTKLTYFVVVSLFPIS